MIIGDSLGKKGEHPGGDKLGGEALRSPRKNNWGDVGLNWGR